MDPMLIRAKTDNGEIKAIEALDSTKIWKEATRHVKKGRYEKALKQYALLVEHFPDSNYYIPSIYNMGWAYERQQRWDDATAMYNRVIKEVPGEDSATDAMYRLAECYAKKKQWRQVVSSIDTILDRSGLSLYDRIEAHARIGQARLELDQLSRAEKSYRMALKLNARAPLEEAVPAHSHFIAGSNFGISRIYHRLFRNLRLVLPVEKMETDLEDKAQLFKQAQSRYLKTIRGGNPYWASASRYYLAKMYEDFYTDILAAEVPDDLNDEESTYYFDELRKKIRPLMEQAMRFYEKTIILSERSGVDNDYTRQTQASLNRLKRYLTDNTLQAEEEKLIRDGKPPEMLGSPPEDTKSKPKGIDLEETLEKEKETPDSLRRRPLHQENQNGTSG